MKLHELMAEFARICSDKPGGITDDTDVRAYNGKTDGVEREVLHARPRRFGDCVLLEIGDEHDDLDGDMRELAADKADKETKESNEKENVKVTKYRLTCYEDSEPYEPGTRTLAEFEDDTGGILCRTAMSKAVDYIHDLLAAVTDSRFDLTHELRKIADDITVPTGLRQLSVYDLPLSVVNLLISKYGLELEVA